MPDLRIEYRPLAGLVPDERNPKRHDLPLIESSFDRFGYAEAIVVDDRTGRLVAGHGRVEALAARRASGAPPPEGITEQGLDWFVPVQAGWASKDDTEAAAFMVAANRLTEVGGWRPGSLVALLADLDDSYVSMLHLSGLLESPPPDPDQSSAPVPATREAQGLREFVLIYPAADFGELQDLLSDLKAHYGEERTSAVVLRALSAVAAS